MRDAVLVDEEEVMELIGCLVRVRGVLGYGGETRGLEGGAERAVREAGAWMMRAETAEARSKSLENEVASLVSKVEALEGECERGRAWKEKVKEFPLFAFV